MKNEIYNLNFESFLVVHVKALDFEALNVSHKFKKNSSRFFGSNFQLSDPWQKFNDIMNEQCFLHRKTNTIW